MYGKQTENLKDCDFQGASKPRETKEQLVATAPDRRDELSTAIQLD